MAELFLWAYPWSLADEPERRLAELVALGVTGVHLAVTYHAATIFTEEAGPEGLLRIAGGEAHVPLSPAPFAPYSPPPASCYAARAPAILAAVRGAGLELEAWVIALHDQRLPGARVVNALGQELPHAHCPLDASNQAWLGGLADSLLELGAFSVLQFEAVDFAPAHHGAHHEIFPEAPGGCESLLLRRCFCPSCRAWAKARGLDPERAWDEARSLLATRRALGVARAHPADGAELSALHLARPGLAAYLAAQGEGILELLRGLRARAAGRARVAVILGVGYRPGALSWVGGLPLSPTLLETVDEVVLCAYYPEAREVARDLGAVLAFLGRSEAVRLGLSLLPRALPDADQAVAAVRQAASLGVRRLSVYNYGLLGKERLRLLPRLREALER